MTAPAVSAQGGLADVLNILLDKGLVIDASVRVSLIGIEILAIEIKVVIASVDTYIRYLEAMQRLEVQRRQLNNGTTPPPAVSQGIMGTYGLLTTPVPAGAVAVPAGTVAVAPSTPQAQVMASETEHK